MKLITLTFLAFICLPAQAAKTKVAFIAALTGMDPNTSRELKRGVEVFQKQKPELAALMDLKFSDTKGDLAYTYQVMSDLYKEGYTIFIGLANSNEAMVAAKYAQQNKEILFVTPFATNTQVTETSDRAFRICFDDAKQGAFLAALVNRKFSRGSVLILENIDSLYSKGLSSYFREGLSKGIKQTTSTYSSVNFDAKTILAAVEKSKPSLIFIPDSSANAATVVREIFRDHKDIQFLGGDGWGGNAIFHAIQGKDDKLKILYTTYWHKDMASLENQRFQQGYDLVFKGSIPSSGAAFTYDAFHLVGKALSKLKPPIDSEAMSKQISRTSILSTTGPLSFSGNSRTPDRPIVIMQLQKGEYVVYKQ